MSTEGGLNVCVYHVSIMGLSCTYHVTGTMGVYPAPITFVWATSEPVGMGTTSSHVGTRSHRDYVGTSLNQSAPGGVM